MLITLDLWNTLESTCPQEEPAKSIWKEKDAKALATITLAVKASELVHIKNCITATGAWSKLSKLYKSTNPGKKVHLFKKLVRFKFNTSEKYSEQIKEFCAIVDILKDIGITLNDDLLSIMLLSSLPDEMESFVVAIECRDELPKFDVLIAKILEEEMRQGSKANDSSGEGIFAVRRRKNFKTTGMQEVQKSEKNVSSSSSKCNLVCFKCKKKGHIRANCRQLSLQTFRVRRVHYAKLKSNHSTHILECSRMMFWIWCIQIYADQ